MLLIGYSGTVPVYMLIDGAGNALVDANGNAITVQ